MSEKEKRVEIRAEWDPEAKEWTRKIAAEDANMALAGLMLLVEGYAMATGISVMRLLAVMASVEAKKELEQGEE